MIQKIERTEDYLYFSFTGAIPAKKNSKIISCRGARPMMFPSKAHKAWRDSCINALQTPEMAPLARVRLVEVTLYHKLNKDGSEPIKSFDLSNLWESIADLLVDMKIIEDDNYYVLPQVLLSFGGFREESGAEVYLYPE